MRKLIVSAILYLAIVSCSSNSNFALTEQAAGSRIDSLMQVIEEFTPGSNKYKAACWLMENITYHYSINNSSIIAFEKKILDSDIAFSKRLLNEWWRSLKGKDTNKVILDAQCIAPQFLKANIESAVSVWQNSPWNREVSFDTFCKYILPYRVSDEPLVAGTRDSLYRTYIHALEGITDVKKAFSVIHYLLKDKIKTADLEFTHNPSALVMEKIQMGSCLQRAIHEVSVMRSLGIPAAVDGVPYWANYSIKGHSWVSLITDDGTYCLPEKDSYDTPSDSLPQKLSYIDSSIFHLKYSIPADYPYPSNFKKRHSIITRLVFDYQKKQYSDDSVDDHTRHFFSDAFKLDVSSDYGCNTTFFIRTNNKSPLAYLCTYCTSVGWVPVSYSKRSGGKYEFSNIGDSVLCLLMTGKNKALQPISAPFLLYDGIPHFLYPDTTVTECASIDRKYPLIGRFLNSWCELIGGVFEGSNDSLFKNKQTLAMIVSTPVFRNILTTKGRSYRYIRYLSPKGIKSPLAEIEIYSAGKQVKGHPFSKGARMPERCFDGNTFSMLDKTHSGYTVGVDLGRAVRVDSIVFYPRNDDNFVHPDHEYELKFFNSEKEWESLEIRKGTGYVLSFQNIPHNALLLLKDLNGGREERPFILRNGKVEWW
ncbi:MAG: hypothetical protein J6I52_02685 [Prevotella sp.]|nr:hypothetical protein [Prevotella sp.]